MYRSVMFRAARLCTPRLAGRHATLWSRLTTVWVKLEAVWTRILTNRGGLQRGLTNDEYVRLGLNETFEPREQLLR